MSNIQQDQIYEYMKNYNKVRFKINQLADIFNTSLATMQKIVPKMHSNKEMYPGFERAFKKDQTANGYYLYFVDLEEKEDGK